MWGSPCQSASGLTAYGPIETLALWALKTRFGVSASLFRSSSPAALNISRVAQVFDKAVNGQLETPLTSVPQLVIFPTAVGDPALGAVAEGCITAASVQEVGERTFQGAIVRGGLRMVSIRRVVVFCAVVGMLFGLASVSAAAQQRKAQPRQAEMTGRMGAPEMVVRGPVTSVTPASGFIVVRKGGGKEPEELPIEIDSKTTITRGGQRASIDAVKPGDMVTVHYTGSPGDVSKMVQVTPGKGTPAGKRAKGKPAAKKTS